MSHSLQPQPRLPCRRQPQFSRSPHRRHLPLLSPRLRLPQQPPRLPPQLPRPLTPPSLRQLPYGQRRNPRISQPLPSRPNRIRHPWKSHQQRRSPLRQLALHQPPQLKLPHPLRRPNPQRHRSLLPNLRRHRYPSRPLRLRPPRSLRLPPISLPCLRSQAPWTGCRSASNPIVVRRM